MANLSHVLEFDSHKRRDSDMNNSECPPFDLSKWDFREFAAFLRSADPAFVVPGAGSQDAIDALARSQDSFAHPDPGS